MAKSDLEDLFLKILKDEQERNGIEVPEPTREYMFAKPRRWRFDFAWPDYKVAVEVEGGLWMQGRHNRAPGMINDMTKYNKATQLGWKVLRFSDKHLKEPSDVFDVLMEVFTLLGG